MGPNNLFKQSVSRLFFRDFKAQYERFNLRFHCLFHLLISDGSRSQMRGESGHPDPEIRGGSWFQEMFFRRPFTPQFQV